MQGKLMSVLDEAQLHRDKELSDLLGNTLETIQSYTICGKDNIKVYDPNSGDIVIDKQKLYKSYKYLNMDGYIRTLMATSVNKRPPSLINLLRTTFNKCCLDFGSGVGTHAIELLSNDNSVNLLDVDGPLLDFTCKRICRRFCKPDISQICGVYHPDSALPDGIHDLVICCDVLEHVNSPMIEIERIKNTMKMGGRLFLEVSHMVKPSSGHFIDTISEWETYGPEYLLSYFKPLDNYIFERTK